MTAGSLKRSTSWTKLLELWLRSHAPAGWTGVLTLYLGPGFREQSIQVKTFVLSKQVRVLSECRKQLTTDMTHHIDLNQLVMHR